MGWGITKPNRNRQLIRYCAIKTSSLHYFHQAWLPRACFADNGRTYSNCLREVRNSKCLMLGTQLVSASPLTFAYRHISSVFLWTPEVMWRSCTRWIRFIRATRFHPKSWEWGCKRWEWRHLTLCPQRFCCFVSNKRRQFKNGDAFEYVDGMSSIVLVDRAFAFALFLLLLFCGCTFGCP